MGEVEEYEEQPDGEAAQETDNRYSWIEDRQLRESISIRKTESFLLKNSLLNNFECNYMVSVDKFNYCPPDTIVVPNKFMRFVPKGICFGKDGVLKVTHKFIEEYKGVFTEMTKSVFLIAEDPLSPHAPNYAGSLEGRNMRVMTMSYAQGEFKYVLKISSYKQSTQWGLFICAKLEGDHLDFNIKTPIPLAITASARSKCKCNIDPEYGLSKIRHIEGQSSKLANFYGLKFFTRYSTTPGVSTSDLVKMSLESNFSCQNQVNHLMATGSAHGNTDYKLFLCANPGLVLLTGRHTSIATVLDMIKVKGVKMRDFFFNLFTIKQLQTKLRELFITENLIEEIISKGAIHLGDIFESGDPFHKGLLALPMDDGKTEHIPLYPSTLVSLLVRYYIDMSKFEEIC